MVTNTATLLARGVDPALYRAWSAMKQRCNYTRGAAYKHYGGRGIKVCARWAEFGVFAADVVAEIGPHPGKGWTLDRKRVNDDYRHGNICWATRATQKRNQRPNSKLKLDAAMAAKIRRHHTRSKCSCRSLAPLYGVSKSTIERIVNGSLWK